MRNYENVPKKRTLRGFNLITYENEICLPGLLCRSGMQKHLRSAAHSHSQASELEDGQALVRVDVSDGEHGERFAEAKPAEPLHERSERRGLS